MRDVYMFVCIVMVMSGLVNHGQCQSSAEIPQGSSIRHSAVQSSDPTPPDETVKLIFIHHSCGQNWLNDGNGGLGEALRDNNYFVSDVNYGWGPGGIGDNTDIGHWWSWFRGSSSTTYMSALYTEYDQHSSYSRLAGDPGGQNEIIMFKSCYPNSNLEGNPGDPPTTGSNPLRGQDCYSGYHTVANAKGIYNDLLDYFATRQDKLFIVITAPPVQDGTWADNARAFNTWLVQDWLDDAGYAYTNVAVFDFYNVLTSNGGNWDTNDLNWETGNHHRYRSGAVQYITNQGGNTAAYPDGGSDNHPSQAGNQKATAEFVPLLNICYHRWNPAPEPCSVSLTAFTGPGTWCAGGSAAITWTSENTSGEVTIDYSTDNGSSWHTIVTGTADDGSYPWTIPDTPSDYCLVKLCDAADAECCAQSSSAFTICDAPVAAFSGTPIPEQGETCEVDFVDHSTGCITDWDWDFGDGSSSDQQHPSHTYACGELYTVRLTVSGPCGSDVQTKGDDIACECPCSLSLVSPDGGEIWCVGEHQNITWMSAHTSGAVNIEYASDGGNTWHPVIGDTPDDGLYSWLIPDSPSVDYRIRIYDVMHTGCGDTSVTSFQVCSCETLEITTETLSLGIEGCPYHQTMGVIGGCPPYQWSIQSGRLPDGITLDNASGTISGQSAEVGSFDFTVQVSAELGGSCQTSLSMRIEEFVAVKGDVDLNCEINILDVVAVINIILETIQPTPDQQWSADCNGPPEHCDGDGHIDILDALKVVGLILGYHACP